MLNYYLISLINIPTRLRQRM